MTVLYCTVGGTPQPILDAIQHWKPKLTVFVASEDDPSTGKPGSWTEVERATKDYVDGRVVARPALFERAGLAEGSWTTLKVPADDPTEVCVRIRNHVQSRAPGQIVIDYTGGTKSMSAGAYLAASLLPGVIASLVTGPRVDTVRVPDGLQRANTVGADVVARFALARLWEAAWARFDYGEAIEVLDTLSKLGPEEQKLRTASLFLSAWDRADHATAKALSAAAPGVLTPRQAQALGRLARGENGEWLGTDLYWMAERRAAAGRYDDATLLLYRCTEYVAQWILRRDHDVDTGNVGDRADLHDLTGEDRNGRRVMGLVAAWTAVARLGGPAAAAAEALLPGLLSFVDRRNHSLYAHGFRPISQADARAARDWFDKRVAPLLHDRSGAWPFEQLPQRLPG